VKPLGWEFSDTRFEDGGRRCVKCGGGVKSISRGRGAEPYCNRCGFQTGKRGGRHDQA